MQPTLDSKNLDFKINLDSNLPGTINTDEVRLRQCLTNLIGNAVKFTNRGHVFVNVKLEKGRSVPYVRFEVEDTGVGIPPERQDQIFESFSQADGSVSRKFGGTGLGLTINQIPRRSTRRKKSPLKVKSTKARPLL